MGTETLQDAFATAAPIQEEDLIDDTSISSSEVTEVTEVTEPESATDSGSGETKSVTSALPVGSKKVTKIFYGSGFFQLRADGVYYVIPKQTKTEEQDEQDEQNEKDEQPQEIWICSYLEILAECDNDDGNDWGVLLEFTDRRDRTHQWAMPRELHRGSGEEYRGELLRQGLKIAPGRKPRALLDVYLQVTKPNQLAKCVNKSGWHGNNFVLPNGTVIGEQPDELLVLQTSTLIDHGVKTKGSLIGWQQTIGKYCAGNSRLMFAVSLAFTVPLLGLLNEESGGFNLRGRSSLGKTTILRASGSTYGSKEFVKSCRATVNGSEGTCAAHNGLILLLDEISQINPQEIIELIYMLANERGKTRSHKSGAARRAADWQLLFLMSGEKTIAQHAAKAGHKTTAGVEVRVIDIGADTGKFGAFENLHDFKNAVEFVAELKQAAAENHGTAGPAFIEKLCRESVDELQQTWRRFLTDFLDETVPEGASEQVKRVAQRFALVAFAGELAIGITLWKETEASQAAADLFKQWLSERGNVEEHEKTALLEQVRLFFESEGSARFEDDKTEDWKINKRAGRRMSSGDQVDYYILPEVFKQEVIKGFDRDYALGILKANEDMQLILGADGNNQATVRIGGTPTKAYRIRIKAAKDEASNEAT